MFNIDRQKATLFATKWIAYLLNLLIIAGILAAVCWWVYELYLSTLPTHYH